MSASTPITFSCSELDWPRDIPSAEPEEDECWLPEIQHKVHSNWRPRIEKGKDPSQARQPSPSVSPKYAHADVVGPAPQRGRHQVNASQWAQPAPARASHACHPQFVNVVGCGGHISDNYYQVVANQDWRASDTGNAGGIPQSVNYHDTAWIPLRKGTCCTQSTTVHDFCCLIEKFILFS